MGFVSALILYKNEEFLACTQTALINTNGVDNDPKVAWIYPNGYGYYQLTFQDPKRSDALTGVWISEYSQGFLVDGTLADVQAKLTAETGAITPVYNGVFPGVVPDPAATYTITRADDGDISAEQDFALAYLQWFIPGTLQRTSYVVTSGVGVSTYTFQAYTDPVPQGNDAVTGETARAYSSNVPAALTGTQKYSFEVFVDGDQVGNTLTEQASLAAIATAAQADATLGPLGTYSVVNNAIQLSTTTTEGVSMEVLVTAS